MIIIMYSSSFIISTMICFFGLFHHQLLLLLLGAPVVVMAERHKHTPNLVELSSRKELVEMAGYGEDKLSSVLISGTLLCSPHKPPTDPLPVAGALVGVSCHTHTRSHSSVEKSNWASGITDELGDFLIDLPSHLHAIPNLHHKCMLRVLRLPRNSLCRPTFAARKTALKLSSFGNGIRTYTAQTPSLYLTPKAASRRNKCTHQLGRRADSGCPVQSYQH
ncbi:uncharacterized protein LOC127807438 [Diospyros lotus]|uniref:uncharacterized protein LOC127807438 n=1 Tax=Diospyros lotus TaxID=55363 RepID=UPI0022517B62|nr:uncharacterized protein LOC127807438 [Diospyros lotus]